MDISGITSESLLEMIKSGLVSIEKHSDGKIFLKKKGSISLSLKNELPDYEIQPKFVIKHMLHEEMRVVRKNINQWLTELERDFAIDDIYNLEKFAISANQFSLILFYTGRQEQAINFCKKLVFFFYKLSKKGADGYYLIQPYINLLRLYRIAKSYDEIEKGFLVLKGTNDNSEIGTIVSSICENIEYKEDKQKYYSVIKNSQIVEFIKSCLEQKKFTLIIERFFDDIETVMQNDQQISDHNTSYKAEALIIAYHCLGKVKEASKICSFFYQNGVVSELQTFSLRMSELYLTLGWIDEFNQEIQKLIKYAERLLNSESPRLSDAFFVFNLVSLIDDDNIKEKLLRQTLSAFKSLEEELAIIGCLKKLVDINTAVYADEYFNYLSLTSYIFTRKDKQLPIKTTKRIDSFLNLFENLYQRLCL